MDNNTPKYELAVGARVVVYKSTNSVVGPGSTGVILRFGDERTNQEGLVCIALEDGGCGWWVHRTELAIIAD